MKRIAIIILIAIGRLPASATIINIPDDYPTIQQGIDASTDGDTVLVQPGTYVENINFNGHNIVLASLFLTTGNRDYISSTIIDGNHAGRVVTIRSGENNQLCITGFTIQNGWVESEDGGGVYCGDSSPSIKSNIIRNNFGFAAGGGICSNGNGRPIIEENVIANNHVDAGSFGGDGGGIRIASGTIRRNIIVGNTASHGSSSMAARGGGICHWGGHPLLIENNTICDNSATAPGGSRGGGLWFLVAEAADVVIRNNIIVFNSLGGGVSGAINDTSWAGWDYNLVYGNEHYDYEGIEAGLHDIQADPLFVDRLSGNYHLMSVVCGDSSDSPCIDAGDPDILDRILDCDWGLGEERSDMGAYGGGDSVLVGVDDNDPPAPRRMALLQNYPNPFNASTLIRYALPEPSQVKIEIFDILGRRVETLIDENQLAGYHQLVWNAAEKSSGIYLYRIEAGKNVGMRKMVLLR